jgi:hypothetical protein
VIDTSYLYSSCTCISLFASGCVTLVCNDIIPLQPAYFVLWVNHLATTLLSLYEQLTKIAFQKAIICSISPPYLLQALCYQYTRIWRPPFVSWACVMHYNYTMAHPTCMRWLFAYHDALLNKAMHHGQSRASSITIQTTRQ